MITNTYNDNISELSNNNIQINIANNLLSAKNKKNSFSSNISYNIPTSTSNCIKNSSNSSITKDSDNKNNYLP